MRAVAVVLFSALVGISTWLRGGRRIGYDPEDFLRGSSVHDAIQLLFEKFSIFPSALCFRNVDFAANQKEMLELYKAVTSSGFAMEAPFANHLSTMYRMLEHTRLNSSWAGKLADAATVAEGRREEERARVLSAVAEEASLNRTNAMPDFAPLGTGVSDAESFTITLLRLLSMPMDSSKAWQPERMNGSRVSLYLDLAGINQMSWGPSPNSTASDVPRIRFSSMPFFTAGLNTDEQYLDAVKKGLDAVKASTLKDSAFIHGSIFSYWEVLSELEPHMSAVVSSLIIGIAIGAVVCLDFDVVSILVACLSCYMLVVTVWGFAVLWAKLNAAFVAGLLVCMGLSIESVAHIVAGFAYARGSVQERLGHALAMALPASLAASCGVIVTLVPLAVFAPLFHLKYVLGMLALHAVLIVLSNCLILPGLLAALAPPVEWAMRPVWIVVTVCRRRWRARTAPETDENAWQRFLKGDS